VPVVRFLHTSDWQIGMTRHFLDGDARPRFQQARIDAIRTIARVATEQECSFVVVAGDVFESNQLQPRTIARTMDALRAFTVPTYLLPGNHDPLDPASMFTRAEFVSACPSNVQVLNGEPHAPVPGVEVHGVPWRSKRPSTDLAGSYAAALPATPAGVIRVLAAHGGVSSLRMGRLDPAIIDERAIDAALAEQRLHYVALGDRHSTYAVGPSGRTWYSGAPEPTDYDEDDPGNVLVVDLDAEHCRVTALPVATWRFVSHRAELNHARDIAMLEAWLDTQPARDRTILKLSLVGALSLGQRARLDEVLAQAVLQFAAVEQWERHTDLAIVPGDEDLGAMQLGGYAREALQSLLAASHGAGETSETARDALTLLYRLAKPVA